MKVNEIFYSLQGEGLYTGTPAVFLRLSGCNMRCWFCDTDHEQGQEMTPEAILQALQQYPSRHIVITGGEPLMQLTPQLTTLLHQAGYFIQIETNGTLPIPEGVSIDWVTCSPKGNTRGNATTPIRLQHIDELKVVYEGANQDMAPYESIPAREYRLQPCDVKNPVRNQQILHDTLQYLLAHPKWHLSLQTHKLLNIS